MRLRTSLAVIAVSLAAVPPPAALAGVEYAVAVLDEDEPAMSVIPWGINDAGVVVGWDITTFGSEKGFRWTAEGGLELLPTPPGQTRYWAREVSDTGIIAGGYEFGEAWTHADGQYTLLGTLQGTTSSEAWGVNDAGDAAGTADPSSLTSYRAFFYDASTGEMEPIAPTFSRAWDVNDARQVAGHQGSAAFRWSPDGGLFFLGPLDDQFTSTFGYAINEAGSVAGEAKDPTNANVSRAFIYTDQGGVEEVPPRGLRNRAWGINDAPAVVGESEATGAGDLGWIWTPAQGTRDLNDLIDPAENMRIVAAFDINNAGQIVGYAFDNDIPAFVAVVLTPIGGPVPVLEFNPPSLDLGDVQIGTTSSQFSTVLLNSGDAPATGLAFGTLEGGFDADTSECGDTLDPGIGCGVLVTFTPTELGPAEAVLEVSSVEGVTASLSLVGNGVGKPEVFTAVAMEVDPAGVVSDGNGVFEPGEVVDAVPSWRNDGTLAVSLTGIAESFSGPGGGALYERVTDAADYGPVEPAGIASCLDGGSCYRLGIDAPAERPAMHWDAFLEETLSDTTSWLWTLHIGESFTDVPRNSLFYPWVETLLHRGVTGGCAATQYCPSAPNARDQMPVFLLKALEGGAYVPSACVDGDEVFDDVPFDSPFCRWIEELAGRGVTAGCGGGNYCPGNSVSRDQMAVFLLKTLEGSGYTPPACTGVFGDVPCPSLFAAWIEDLVSHGITAGCGGGNYCPSNPVSRDQMAVFLGRTFSLTLYGP